MSPSTSVRARQTPGGGMRNLVMIWAAFFEGVLMGRFLGWLWVLLWVRRVDGCRRRRPHLAKAAGMIPYPTFESVEAFYLDVPARHSSPEVDFGVTWTDAGEAWPSHRVSWVQATGEVYAVCLGLRRTVEILGLASTRAEADAKLAGWADGDRTLDWARERLASEAAAKIDP